MKNQITTILNLLTIVGAILLGFFMFELALVNIVVFWTIVVLVSLVAFYIDMINRSADDVVRIEAKHGFAIVIMVGLIAATIATVTAFTVVKLV